MFFFFQAEDGIRDHCVTGVQTCALPISGPSVGEGYTGELRCPVPHRAAVSFINSGTFFIFSTFIAASASVAAFVEIGRASCRERVVMSGGGGFLHKNEKRREVGMSSCSY